MQSQKDAVVMLVKATLGSRFTPSKDNALIMLSHQELEAVKAQVATLIIGGQVAYSKDATKVSEVIAYARSMVMNHLKKAKELNGGQAHVAAAGQAHSTTSKSVQPKQFRGINMELLPAQLAEHIRSL
jgi:hypothetical protein